MKIITIEREFGSGGRELGKRMADAMGIPCYDQEIIDEVAKLHGLDPDHVKHISESDVRAVYPMTIGRRLHVAPARNPKAISVLASQQEVIRSLASEGDCIIVGRCADIILRDLSPMNLFVYADQQSRLLRCAQRASAGESQKELLGQMQRIDKERTSYRELLANTKWGRKETYHLCVNTSGKEIKSLVPGLVAYVNGWFSV